MRSPHYHCATISVHIAISIRAAYSRQRQLNRYRRLENDLKKVYGKPSARKHGGRSYNIGANNGSKRGHARAHAHTRPHTRARAGAHGRWHGRGHGHTAAGTTIGRKRSGRRDARPHGHGRRTKKSTVDQASAGAHTGTGAHGSEHGHTATRARTPTGAHGRGRKHGQASGASKVQGYTVYRCNATYVRNI